MSEDMQHAKHMQKESTLEDLIYEDLEAEESDNEKYMDLALQADCEYPDRGYGCIIRDIAKEEEQHRKHLSDILYDIKKHNCNNR